MILELKKNKHLLYFCTFFDGGDDEDGEDDSSSYSNDDGSGTDGTGGYDDGDDSDTSPTLNEDGQTVAEAFEDFATGGFVGGFSFVGVESYTDPDTGDVHTWNELGDVTTTHIDGSVTTYNNDGTKTHTSLDGTTVTYSPDGSWVSVEDGITTRYDATTNEYSTNSIANSFKVFKDDSIMTVELKKYFNAGVIDSFKNIAIDTYSEEQLENNTYFFGVDSFGIAYSGVYANDDFGWSLNTPIATYYDGNIKGVETSVIDGYTVTHIEDGLLDKTFVTNFDYNQNYEMSTMATLGYEAFGVTGLKVGTYVGGTISLLATATTPMFGVIGLVSNFLITIDTFSQLSAFNTYEQAYDEDTHGFDSFKSSNKESVRVAKDMFEDFDEYTQRTQYLNFDDDIELDLFEFLAGGRVYNYAIARF
jgi:hypothetical protein